MQCVQWYILKVHILDWIQGNRKLATYAVVCEWQNGWPMERAAQRQCDCKNTASAANTCFRSSVWTCAFICGLLLDPRNVRTLPHWRSAHCHTGVHVLPRSNLRKTYAACLRKKVSLLCHIPYMYMHSTVGQSEGSIHCKKWGVIVTPLGVLGLMFRNNTH